MYTYRQREGLRHTSLFTSEAAMADLNGGGMAAFDGGEDFEEEEVWGVMKSKAKSKSSITRKGSSSSAWRSFASTPRAIPRSATAPPHQSSAPVGIPDWSKILREKPKKNLWDDACDDGEEDDGGERKYNCDDDDGDGDGDEMVPPHEYLARRLAATQIASFSMCEGVGRTLKGRDLSKLRNTILTKTGFLE